MTYRSAIGITGAEPPLPTGVTGEDPFIFSDLDRGLVCLKSQWPIYADLCSQMRAGQLDPELAPDPKLCAMYLSADRRSTWYKLPICWEVNVETKQPETAFGPQDCKGERREYHVAQMAECIRDPFASERCALYAHPSVIKLIQEQCGGDAIFKEARKKAERDALFRTLAWVGAAALLAGAGYLAYRRKAS